jgi:ubiquinone/menaquinone biosynthesis C-methylase UbiE
MKRRSSATTGLATSCSGWAKVPLGIEFARTKELLRRFLPPPPATVLDIGGGPGTYAVWLADLGHRVRLIDAVPLHMEQAAEAVERARHPFTVEVGDARRLEQPDSSVDAVLLFGPLYHLTERTERIQALTEARRVMRTDGTVLAAAISRFASLFDGLASGLGDPTFDAIVERDVREGQHRNPTDRIEWFTTAYFHHPDELPKEIDVAGLAFVALLGTRDPCSLCATSATTQSAGTTSCAWLGPLSKSRRCSA